MMHKSTFSFRKDTRGTITAQTALLFGAIAMAVSVLAAPLLQNVTEKYAKNRAMGIDHVLTGSVEKPATRYIIRKSVLSRNQEQIDISN